MRYVLHQPFKSAGPITSWYLHAMSLEGRISNTLFAVAQDNKNHAGVCDEQFPFNDAHMRTYINVFSHKNHDMCKISEWTQRKCFEMFSKLLIFGTFTCVVQELFSWLFALMNRRSWTARNLYLSYLWNIVAKYVKFSMVNIRLPIDVT